ncbi:MAG: hypothetical protein ABJA76_00220 [Mucilaginibacter sp.]
MIFNYAHLTGHAILNGVLTLAGAFDFPFQAVPHAAARVPFLRCRTVSRLVARRQVSKRQVAGTRCILAIEEKEFADMNPYQ